MQLILNDLPDESEVIVRPEARMTGDEFFDFCMANPDVEFEMTADGEIEIVPPVGMEGSRNEGEVFWQLNGWAKHDRRGIAFPSSAGYILPNGAGRAPDASWVELSRWNALPKDRRERFAPFCPDFVVEVKSPSNRMSKLHAKMREYIENGAKLGWLIDPDSRVAFIYRPGQEPERLE